MIDKKIFHKGIGGVVFHKSLVRKISHGKNWQELPQFSDKIFKFARFNIFEKKSFPRWVGMEGRIPAENASLRTEFRGWDAILSSFLLVETRPFVKKARLSRDFQPVPGRLSSIPTNL
jgi:hypothetical protein